MLKYGQIYLKNLAVFTPFLAIFNIMNEKVKTRFH